MINEHRAEKFSVEKILENKLIVFGTIFFHIPTIRPTTHVHLNLYWPSNTALSVRIIIRFCSYYFRQKQKNSHKKFSFAVVDNLIN